MNYKHIYHAGNFADVAKHVALLTCLNALKKKPTPFMVLDTHAGRGIYDLHSPESRKSQEADAGVQALIKSGIDEPALADYFAAIRAVRGDRLGRYPGSPALIGASLRAGDRAEFVEMMPAEARAALREVGSEGKLYTHIGDGYEQMKAQLPPRERRGLVLIDPPYEDADEVKKLLVSLRDAYERWPTGVYLIWYPIRSAEVRRSIHNRMQALRIPKMMFADLAVHPDDASIGLAGSGMIIVNAPFGVEERLRESYDAIHRHLAAAGGYVDIDYLTPERL
jgi:23S rRNA (adenine2030-N6)-methyltransferase